MSDDVVHVGLNEGPCQYFKPYDNGRPDDHTRSVPHPVWEGYDRAKRDLETAEAGLADALEVLLDALKANPRPGDTSALRSDEDYIVECEVAGDRIHWP